MARLPGLCAAERRAGQSRPAAPRADASRDRKRRQAAVHRQHAVHQHDSRRRAAARCPADRDVERRIKSLVRWNAMAMVVRANKADEGIGGHISTFASAATLYEVGFNHFFRGAATAPATPTSSIFQGHASPGIYARAFLEGRLDEDAPRELPPRAAAGRRPVVVSASVADARLLGVPDRVDGPRPDHGDLPGALHPLPGGSRPQAARPTQKVWAFLGDGETDEPESLGAITLPAREKLDNLIFVINCNLQRLDGPVRGNGKIIQELEAAFRGAGWNVIKVIWGRDWDRAARQGQRRPARQAHGRDRRRPVSEVRRRVGRVRPRALLRRRSAPARDGQAPVRRPAEEAVARRPRSGQGLRRLQGGGRSTRARRPSSWPARSRATASARRAKARTSRTSRRR